VRDKKGRWVVGTVFLTEDGNIYTLGYNENGILGFEGGNDNHNNYNNPYIDESDERSWPIQTEPKLILSTQDTDTVKTENGDAEEESDRVDTTQFVPAMEETFDFENDGYTGTMTFKSWYGILGTGNPVAHPADPSVFIPAADTQSMVIPFYVEVRNTTSDASFIQDMHISWKSLVRLDVFSLFIKGSWVDQDDYGKIQRVIRDSSSGSKMSYCGYSILSNIVSPSSPTPDIFNADQSMSEFNITINVYISDTLRANVHTFSPYQDEAGITFRNGEWGSTNIFGGDLVFEEGQ
jgi:hypothetical protein